jgi:succinyl-CoA reductase
MVKAIVGSALIDSEDKITVRDPSNGQKLAEIPNLGRDVVKSAIDIAHEALPALQGVTISKRSGLLLATASRIREQAGSLALTMTSEIGRPIKNSRAEILRTASIFELAAIEVRRAFEGEFVPLESYDYPAGNEKRFALVKREPIGVVGSITPFNFPSSSFAHKVGPALAVGNTVVHKPTVLAPLTQLALAQILLDVGFPPGSINVVTGSSSMIGKELVENPKVGLISFTGSEKVGLELAGRAIEQGKRVIMELGGSDAEIVLEDADLQKAAAAAALGRFDYAGQFCNATKRILVRKEVTDSFTDSMVTRLKSMKVGDPRKEETDIGPLISEDAVKSMEEFLDDAKKGGAEVVYQGESPSPGFFFPPTIVKTTKPLRIMEEEVFGPIVPVMSTETDDEAVTIANTSPYGLDASVFSKDFSRAYKIACRLKVGSVIINDTTRLRWDNLPFGGVKKSGIGRESIRDTMREMTETKIIAYNFG